MASSKKFTSTKKRTVKKPGSKRKVSSEFRSLKVAKDNPPFRTFKVTRQTFYWATLMLYIVVLQLWIVKLQLDVATQLEQYEAVVLGVL